MTSILGVDSLFCQNIIEHPENTKETINAVRQSDMREKNIQTPLIIKEIIHYNTLHVKRSLDGKSHSFFGKTGYFR